MHKSVRQALQEWIAQNRATIDKGPCADVGAYNINGAVKDDVPHAVGFDVVAGPGVDVVVRPYVPIDQQHYRKYAAITAVSSFQFGPVPGDFARTCQTLAHKGTILFLTMCEFSCRTNHSTSAGSGWGDSFRMSERALAQFWEANGWSVRVRHEGHNYLMEGVAR